MTTTPAEAHDVTPPVIAVGPCGSDFLHVDRSVEAALAHLVEHGAALGDGFEGHGAPTLFDGRGRQLRVDTAGETTTLIIADEEERRGELCARIEEAFAHARERAYGDPELLDGLGALEPADVRPPAPPRPADGVSGEPAVDEYDRFLAELLEQMSPDPDMHHHRASWWHNLFHRLG